MKKKKFVQDLNEHSIQDEEQKGGAFKKKVTLDTAFKSALEMSGRRPQNNIKLALILVLVFAVVGVGLRSEEHTSELQSRPHLVCRLLLEKKKKKKKTQTRTKYKQ